MPKKSVRVMRLSATPEGVRDWEAACGFGPVEAAMALSTSMRTYFRWKKQGLPLPHRNHLLLAMEAALPRKRGG